MVKTAQYLQTKKDSKDSINEDIFFFKIFPIFDTYRYFV